MNFVSPSLSGAILSRRDVAHVPGLPVGTRVGERVGQQPAIRRGHVIGQRDRGVAADGVRLDQLAAEIRGRRRDVQRRLVLAAVVAQEEVVRPRLLRHAEPLVGVELGQSAPAARPDAAVLATGLGHGVLGVDPALRGVAVQIFEPAVRVRDADAEVVIRDRAARARRIGVRRQAQGRHAAGQQSEGGGGAPCARR